MFILRTKQNKLVEYKKALDWTKWKSRFGAARTFTCPKSKIKPPPKTCTLSLSPTKLADKLNRISRTQPEWSFPKGSFGIWIQYYARIRVRERRADIFMAYIHLYAQVRLQIRLSNSIRSDWIISSFWRVIADFEVSSLIKCVPFVAPPHAIDS